MVLTALAGLPAGDYTLGVWCKVNWHHQKLCAIALGGERSRNDEQPECIASNDWRDIGCVALGWVRRSCSYAHASPTDIHTYTRATYTNTHARPADHYAYPLYHRIRAGRRVWTMES